ncbi:MAG: hypothetical protein Q7S74_05820 [Nanoarchaeota archaeon]|nr:hypothetical protein [Nanoarchaeota archaeon]
MEELIGKISTGSKMDQIYIPKNRVGFSTGEYVIISPLKYNLGEKEGSKKLKLHFYNTGKIEPIKIKIIEDVMQLIETKVNTDNIIITGSFLDKGFGFNDIDIIILSQKEINTEIIKDKIDKLEGIKTHIILLDNNTLLQGLSTDPLYSLMLSKYVSKNRMIFKAKRKIDYRFLDLNLLKSKDLINNFDILNGKEKYYFTMNMIAILLFIEGKRLNKDLINREIERKLHVKIKDLKENLVSRDFLDRYKRVYDNTFNLILDKIKRVKGEQK